MLEILLVKSATFCGQGFLAVDNTSRNCVSVQQNKMSKFIYFSTCNKVIEIY